ncbi:MAG: SPOR domain-containing protein [Planctomycetota bacterium]
MTAPRADRFFMQNRPTFLIGILSCVALLAGCATAPSRTTPMARTTSDYERAFRAEAYADAAQLASQAPRRDERARLIEGMARAELGERDRAGALLRPLLRSSDPEVRGRAAATLGIMEQASGSRTEATRLLRIAAADLSGPDAMWAERYANRAAGTPDIAFGSDGTGGEFQIQFGSFSTQARAQRHAQAVTRFTRSSGIASPRIETVQRGARTLFAVRAGAFGSRTAAATAAAQLNTETAVVRIN